jgi:hypothetical protein
MFHSEISWQSKHYAKAALAKDLEEREMASAHENSDAECDNETASTKKEDGARRRRNLMAYGGPPRNTIIDHRSLEQYGTESEDSQRYSAELVDKRTSGDFEGGMPQSTSLRASRLCDKESNECSTLMCS